MDLETIFYIVFGLIYLLSRAGKKKKPKAPPPPVQQSPPQTPKKQSSPSMPPAQDRSSGTPPTVVEEQPEPAPTFEDLLRELSGIPKEKPKPKPAPEPIPTPAPKPYRDPIPEVKNVHESKRALDDQKRLLEEEKQSGSGQDDKRDTTKRSVRFEEFKIQDETNHTAIEIKRMLQNPDDVKNAIVLSEILQRKF